MEISKNKIESNKLPLVDLKKGTYAVKRLMFVWSGRIVLQYHSLIILLKVSLSDEELQDLHKRLGRARFGEDLVDTQFQYGFPAR